MTKKSKLRKLMEEDTDNNQEDLFYDSVRDLYKTAYMNCVKWLPLDSVLYKSCTFLDFPKKSSASFDQVMWIVEDFPTWNKKLCSNPQHLDVYQEEFINVSGFIQTKYS